MFERPPEGGLLSFEVGRGCFKEPTAFRRCAERARRSLALCRLRWAVQHSAKMRYCCVGGVVPAVFSTKPSA